MCWTSVVWAATAPPAPRRWGPPALPPQAEYGERREGSGSRTIIRLAERAESHGDHGADAGRAGWLDG